MVRCEALCPQRSSRPSARPAARSAGQRPGLRGTWPADVGTGFADHRAAEHPVSGAQSRLGTLNDQAVAAILLVPGDPQFWPDDPPGEALYLHKLAVHPGRQGRGLSTPMIRAAVQATRAAERPWLRLDTDAERPKLRSLYERQGFLLVREGHMDGWPAAWYELRVEERARQ